jgi:hypothetical protein
MNLNNYDKAHAIKFDKTLNIYMNNNAGIIIHRFLDEINTPDTVEQKIQNNKLIYELYSQIQRLRKILNKSDDHITNIGARVFHYIGQEHSIKCYLLQVYRGYEYI